MQSVVGGVLKAVRGSVAGSGRVVAMSALALSLMVSVPVAPAQAQRGDAIESSLRSAVAFDPELAEFYQERDYRPVWVRRGRLIPEADRVVDAIRHNGRDGQFLGFLVERAREGSPGALAEAEWRLSRALLTMARQPIRNNVGMIYVDPELAPVSREFRPRQLRSSRQIRRSLASLTQANPIYNQLSRGLQAYRTQWAGLPDVKISAGASMRKGQSGARVRALRKRLGLTEDGRFDEVLDQRVRAYQQAHGLPVDGIVGRGTIASLNRGSEYYERLIVANMERARAIPANPGRRYILVDAGASRMWMYENGRPVDSMKVIVGKPTEQTPMMASPMQYAILNPYWNVPPDLVQKRIAPNVLDRGLSYLRNQGYQVLSDWTDRASVLDPSKINWEAVAAGRQEVRVRQLPGPDNFMGDVKFEMPNEHGIYLHDTPDRHLFNEEDRRLSSGCVRVEDAQRLATWLFGRPLRTRSNEPEQRIDLPDPVPVYITYLTAAPSETGGIVFRNDVYGRDAELLASIGDSEVRLAAGDGGSGAGSR